MKEREMSETLEGYNAREAQSRRSVLISRHSLVTRVTHWINLVCVIILLMSGLQIFNAHPALYWGQAGADPAQAWLEIGAREAHNEAAGFTRVGNFKFETKGILGVCSGSDGKWYGGEFTRA